MERRNFLKGVGLLAGGSALLAVPHVAGPALAATVAASKPAPKRLEHFHEYQYLTASRMNEIVDRVNDLHENRS